MKIIGGLIGLLLGCLLIYAVYAIRDYLWRLECDRKHAEWLENLNAEVEKDGMRDWRPLNRIDV